MNNYYDILGVSKNANSSEIKAAFKKMAKLHHPDTGGNSDTFKNINEAYQTLNDPNKKAEYDIKINTTYSNKFNFSFDDFFKNNNTYTSEDGFYDDPFVKSHYGDHSNQNKPKKKGTDLKISLDVYPEDTISGISKKFVYYRDIICESCNSNGYINEPCSICNKTGIFNNGICYSCNGMGNITTHCNTCKGSGFIKEKKEVNVNIPKGVTIDSSTKMKKFGNQGNNGEYGDLIIYIKDVISSTNFKMSPGLKDKYVYTESVIDFFDAIIGTESEYKTLRGTIKVKIKPMQIFKDNRIQIPNSGIPKQFGKQEYTPHIIFLHIIYPNLSEAHIEYIKKVKQELNKISDLEKNKTIDDVQNEII